MPYGETLISISYSSTTEIYGLTKAGPDLKWGSITRTSPYGTVEHPFNPGTLADCRGTFSGPWIWVKLTSDIMVEAARHDGTSLVEVLQNCVIFNDKTHAVITDRAFRQTTIVLRHGEPMVYGKDNDKGLVLDGLG